MKGLATLLLRVTGIICLIRAGDFICSFMGNIFMIYDGAMDEWGFALMYLPNTIFLIAAFVTLFVYSDKIANRLFTDIDSADQPEVLAVDEWCVLASTVIGVFLLIRETPAKITQIVINLYIHTPENTEGIQYIRRGGMFLMARTIVQAGFALYLVCFPRSILGLIKRIRIGQTAC